MTTEIPSSIGAPDELKTRIGMLEFKDGFPSEKTAQLIYDQLDFQCGVESLLLTALGASLVAFRKGIRKYGPDNSTGILWQRLNSKALLLTPNTTVIYVFVWLDTKNGPMVVESPPRVLSFIDDFWFRYVTDIGMAGPDKGKGGKYLVLPPGHEGDVPDGYYPARSKTYGNWLLMRGSSMEDIQKLKIYPLAKADNPLKFNLVNVEMESLNTLHSTDFSYFKEINQLIQEEHNSAQNSEVLGLFSSIGIEKDKPSQPNELMQAILTEAATVSGAASRVML